MLVTQCKQEQILCYQHVKQCLFYGVLFICTYHINIIPLQSQFTKNKIDKLSTSLQ